ncbi:ubiquitin-conjugating enzyme E2 D3 [Reticulomyxa filosa]|uniref:Ubiquitin-conjugating enzyme E2 D3 n=1 Tax=Reticulomyxa filosa TaxID=46433 RepID=X6MJI8_RETFI|nr:ubiquitin-conjugating enzyme E2 D3 [Reticulomyxa filosa]|eukprot:ETO13816.1 ubiquitin-conjugating enzyme E2 D3 [Reticulomyxa filosa]
MSKSKTEKRLLKELERLSKEPVPGCSAQLRGKNVTEWEAIIEGPRDSPYENGIFKLDIDFPKETWKHLLSSLFVYLKSLCFIRNIFPFCIAALICLSWFFFIEKTNKVDKVLLSLIALLQEPNPDDPLCSDVASVYKKNRKKHDETAKDWTKKYIFLFVLSIFLFLLFCKSVIFAPLVCTLKLHHKTHFLTKEKKIHT